VAWARGAGCGIGTTISWGTAVDVGDVVTGVDVDGELGPTGGVGTTLSWGVPSVVGDVVAGVGADDEPDEVV
jgi:hypothetical protein